MRVLTTITILLSYFIHPMPTDAQSSHKHLREGDKAYKQERFDVAEESYRKAIDKAPNAKGSFNLGNTVYNQERYEEAVQHYQTSINAIADDAERAEATYNLGNAQLKNGQLEDAIESYKEAVRINPEDNDIRQNLYLAKLLKKEEQQQQQQENQEQENQQSEEESEEKQKQEQEQQQGENEQEQEQSSQAEIDNEGGESSAPEEAQELSKEDAEKLLQVIENEEKNVQEKLRKVSANKKKPKKDW